MLGPFTMKRSNFIKGIVYYTNILLNFTEVCGIPMGCFFFQRSRGGWESCQSDWKKPFQESIDSRWYSRPEGMILPPWRVVKLWRCVKLQGRLLQYLGHGPRPGICLRKSVKLLLESIDFSLWAVGLRGSKPERAETQVAEVEKAWELPWEPEYYTPIAVW